MKAGKVDASVVAVLGGGNVGQTAAADFALAGYSVRLFDFPEYAPRSLGEVMRTKKIELSGGQSNLKNFKRSGTATLNTVTTDIGTAVKGARIIIVAIPATGHPRLFAELAPHLEDGQIVNIFPDNFGSLMLRDLLDKAGSSVNIIVGAWHSAPYGTRLSSPGHANLAIREANQIYDTLPSCDADQFIEEVRGLPIFGGVSDFVRAQTVIGVGFANANPLVHVPGSILNVGAMEVSQVEDILAPKGQWNLYKHGMSPAVSRVQLAFYREEQAIMGALGLKMIPEYPERQFFSKYSVMAMEYFIPFGVATLMGDIFGPNSVQDRYFTEDIPVGTVARYNLAKYLGIEVPVIRAMIELGSIICQRDFFVEGMTLAKMGIEGLSKQQLLTYLREGKK